MKYWLEYNKKQKCWQLRTDGDAWHAPSLVLFQGHTKNWATHESARIVKDMHRRYQHRTYNLWIRRMDGTVQEERTYGKDNRRSKG